MAIIQTVDVGQQQHSAGLRRLRHTRRKAIIVAKADFLGGHRVILVNHRHRARIQQAGQRGGGVQIAPAILKILQRQQQLRRIQPMRAQQFGPQARQRDLAHRRRRLRIGKAASPALVQPEPPRAQRNCARGYDDHILPARARRRDFFHQPCQPGTARAILAHQQRRADLDNKAGRKRGIGQVVQRSQARGHGTSG